MKIYVCNLRAVRIKMTGWEVLGRRPWTYRMHKHRWVQQAESLSCALSGSMEGCSTAEFVNHRLGLLSTHPLPMYDKTCPDWTTLAALEEAMVQFPLGGLVSGKCWAEAKPGDWHNLMMPRTKYPFGGGFSKHRLRAGATLGYGQGLP